MTLTHGDILRQILKDKDTLKKLPKQIGSEAELFFKKGFQKQAWQGDNGDEPWAKRVDNPNMGKGILIGKGTANLMKGIRKDVSGNNIAVKVTGVASIYADIHNFGGTIKVTPAMKAHFWKLFYEHAKIQRGGHRQPPRALSAQANWYRSMALQKVGKIIKIKKRQFIGQSKQLDKLIDALIERQFKTT